MRNRPTSRLLSLVTPAVLLTSLSVALPAPQISVNVDAFGATPFNDTDDDGPAIRNAIAATLGTGTAFSSSTVSFTSGGRYVVRSTNTLCSTGRSANLYISATCSGQRLENVSLLGNGATLVSESSVDALFRLEGASNVTIDDFQFDIETRPYIGGEITSATPGQVRFTYLDGNSDPTFFQSSLLNDGFGVVFEPNYPGNVRISNQFDHFRATALWFDPISFEYVIDMTNGTAAGVQNFAVGDSVVYCARKIAGNTLGQNIRLDACSGVMISNVTTYAAGTMFVNGGNNTSTSVFDCLVQRDSGRMISINGDGVHMSNSPNTKIRRCGFEGQMDDGVHLKRNSSGFLIDSCLFIDKRGGAIKLDHDATVDISETGTISNNYAQRLSSGFFFHATGDYSGVTFSGNTVLDTNRKIDETNFYNTESAWGAAFVPVLAPTLTLVPDITGGPASGDQLILGSPSINSVWDVLTCRSCDDPSGSGLGGSFNFINENDSVMLHRTARQQSPSDWLYASVPAGPVTNSVLSPAADQNYCDNAQYWVFEPLLGVAYATRIKHRQSGLYLTIPTGAATGSVVTLEAEIPLSNPDSRRQAWFRRGTSSW